MSKRRAAPSTHHYMTDENGIILKVNLIVGTTNNHAAICMSIKKCGPGLRKGDEVHEGPQQIEMAFRAYDPCYGCATHAAVPGDMPLEVTVKSEASRDVIASVKRNM